VLTVGEAEEILEDQELEENRGTENGMACFAG